jgi:hypothetical protein
MPFTGNYSCDTFLTGLPSGTFNFAPSTPHVFRIALYTNAATLDAATPGYTATGELVTAGYTAGGQVLTVSQPPAVNLATGVTYLSFANPVWALPNAAVVRGALIYKFDGATNPAVCVLDFGTDKSPVAGVFTVQFPLPTSTAAIIRVARSFS